jgi:uncharacterized protein YidB (DUF937 family)
MAKKKGTVVYLSEEDKNNLETIANQWGISQSSAVQRLIRDYINTTATLSPSCHFPRAHSS